MVLIPHVICAYALKYEVLSLESEDLPNIGCAGSAAHAAAGEVAPSGRHGQRRR
ncbi:hypothetical protein K788_0007385 (plasmid) [Paraburkholderia caribensis MBA4]|uniref:Uncharacterized protein n=1 Tax=Paraburkholderia caribensis MBA4 TaxID=1323664 RepID=A0A0P0RRG6_9BURK|nr:hypothetical protein K788_0007385 [Paraburkholderia caribensis MBA4]